MLLHKKSKKELSRSATVPVAGYALIENMFVMPIVFLVMIALIFAGCMLHAQCAIESAARRGVIYASKLICDPQYGGITANATVENGKELNELSSSEFDFTGIRHYEPYRYIPLLSRSFPISGKSSLETDVENYVRKVINQSNTWMFDIEMDSIVCDIDNYVITQSIEVEVKASYHMPEVFHLLGMPETYDLTAGSVMTVSDQDEFIRNVDFAADLIGRAAEKLGVMEKVTEPLQKLMNFVSKVFN